MVPSVIVKRRNARGGQDHFASERTSARETIMGAKKPVENVKPSPLQRVSSAGASVKAKCCETATSVKEWVMRCKGKKKEEPVVEKKGVRRARFFMSAAALMGAGYGVTGIIDPQKLDTYFLTKEVG